MLPEVSVVMPSLNEEGTIGTCIETVQKVFAALKIEGEIIVADSSSDRTPEIAESLGAIVVTPSERGYGNAYRTGIEKATGDFLVMGDADLTYDFKEIPKFLEPLNKDADMVMGNRFGGAIHKGSMPWLHQYIGNPLLTKMLNVLFQIKISDAHCGLRSLTRSAYERLNLKSSGMEFASEMVIEAGRKGMRIVEIPIDYYPRNAPSKLHSFRDGWRHIQFMIQKRIEVGDYL